MTDAPDSGRRIRAVLGLGNPGPRYAHTRHNAGFLVADGLRAEAGGRWIIREQREEAEIEMGGSRLVLVRPLAYMNLSGLAARFLCCSFGLSPEEILVVVDDVALPEGRLRIRLRGGPGGHNGLASVEECLESDAYPRLRVGVGAPAVGVDMAGYVLEPMSGDEWEDFGRTLARASEAVRMVVQEGIGPAMNRFNPAPSGNEEIPA